MKYIDLHNHKLRAKVKYCEIFLSSQRLQDIIFSPPLISSTITSSNPPVLLQAYYREGVALQCLGKHSEALAAFSAGLAQDPKSLQLLAGLVEAAMKSPLKGQHMGNIFKSYMSKIPNLPPEFKTISNIIIKR